MTNVQNNDFYQIHKDSSRGPTDDGRLKPDIVVPTFGYNNITNRNTIYSTMNTSNYGRMEGLSSPASAIVSGVIALMIEQWNRNYAGRPYPSTIKASLLHTAIDLEYTGTLGNISTLDGPDYTNGYGAVSAKDAIDIIKNGDFIESNISDENDIDLYSINITNQYELKVTLAWDDIPAEPFVAVTLVNDLDLYLLSPSGVKYYPWTLNPNLPNTSAVRNQSDNLNVVEQVYVNESEIEDGEWLVVIKMNSGCDESLDCPQKYSLVSEEKLSSSISPIEIDSNLISYYKLDNNSLDSISSNNGLASGNLNYILGYNNYSANFDGSTDNIQLPDTSDLEFTNEDFTISAWLKTSDSSEEYILSNYQANTPAIHIRKDSSGRIIFYSRDSNNNQLTYTSSNSYADDTWHNAIISRNSSDNKIKYYLDGNLLFEQVDLRTGNFYDSNSQWQIGKSYTYLAYIWTGLIDDISFWNRSLNNNEIIQLSLGGIKVNNPIQDYSPLSANFGLKAHYEFEDNVNDSKNSSEGIEMNGILYSSSGYKDKSIILDGSFDYVKFNKFSQLEFADENFTISAWFKTSDFSDEYILSNYQANTPSIHIRKDSFGRIVFYSRDTNNNQLTYTSSNSYNDSIWHNVILVRDSANNKIKHYVDGTLLNEQADLRTGNFYDSNSYWQFGKSYTYNQYLWTGELDEISFWARALNQSEILNLY
ncbi:MAG: S8 family serine peptidase, partial [Nanoarchaeota archaeon]|nr:S8 family serine peptidase [Nanoarchaeota archaeon]